MLHNGRCYLILNLASDIISQISRSAQTVLRHIRNKLRHALVICEFYALVVKRLNKFVEHKHRYGLKIFERQVIEHDYLVNSAYKLRTQKLPKRFHRFFSVRIALILRKTENSLSALAAGIGGHNDYRVFKACGSALRIRYFALIKNLKKDIHNIRVGFFNLIKQDDRIRLSANLFGKLSRIVITDISGWRTDYPRH